MHMLFHSHLVWFVLLLVCGLCMVFSHTVRLLGLMNGENGIFNVNYDSVRPRWKMDMYIFNGNYDSARPRWKVDMYIFNGNYDSARPRWKVDMYIFNGNYDSVRPRWKVDMYIFNGNYDSDRPSWKVNVRYLTWTTIPIGLLERWTWDLWNELRFLGRAVRTELYIASAHLGASISRSTRFHQSHRWEMLTAYVVEGRRGSSIPRSRPPKTVKQSIIPPQRLDHSATSSPRKLIPVNCAIGVTGWLSG